MRLFVKVVWRVLHLINEHIHKIPLCTLLTLPKRYIFHFSLLKHTEIAVNVEVNTSLSNKVLNDTVPGMHVS